MRDDCLAQNAPSGKLGTGSTPGKERWLRMTVELSHDPRRNGEAMKRLDLFCAGMLFVLPIVDCLFVPRGYIGRIWILGTLLAVLFTAMLNALRIRNGRGVKGLKLFCIAANLTMLVFAIALMASIGKSRTLLNPQVPLVGFLLLIETARSLGKNS